MGINLRTRRNLPALIAGFGIAWGILVLGISFLTDPSRHNLALAVSIVLSGLYTLAWYATRRLWLPLCRPAPKPAAIAIGVFNAAAVETLFLAVGVLLGAPDIAAAPNLLVDLLVTMPWYIGMVALFVLAQSRARFPLWAVLFLGGLYEVGGDGLVGGLLIPLASGGANIPLLCLCLPTVSFWQFIPVYSSMVLPPALVLSASEYSAPPGVGSRWVWAALPLLWLIPYAVYALGLMLLISAG
jgi:hypothetical protein